MTDQGDELRQQLFESRARRIHAHRERFFQAKAKYVAELTKLFPLGAYVCWMHSSRSSQRGHVILHDNNGRLRVRNSSTHADLWIEPYQILQFRSRGKA